MCQVCFELPATLAALIAVFPFLRTRITAIYRNHQHNHLRKIGAF